MYECRLHAPPSVKLSAEAFGVQRLKDFRSGKSSFLVCLTCDTKVKELKQKVAGITSRCTFKYPVHNERCTLYDASDKWPGKEKKGRNHISREDKDFLERLPLNPQYAWWHKLWGRKLDNGR